MPTSAAPSTARRRGVAALAIGLAALVLGLIPPLGAGTWALALAGAALGCAGLLRGRRRGLPVAAVLVSLVALFVGPAVALGAGGGSAAPLALTGDGHHHGRADTSGYGSFAARTIDGSGDRVVPLPAGAVAGVVRMTHAGRGDFTVGAETAEGVQTDLLTTAAGRYRGTAAFGLDRFGQRPARLSVVAAGRWRLVVEPVSAAPALRDGGTGDGVFRSDGAASTRTAVRRGSGGFVIAVHTAAPGPDLVVNAVGPFRGAVRLPAGPAVVVVLADGPWSLS